MTDQVERFGLFLGMNHMPELRTRPNGPVVRYSDYEKLKAEYNEATQELAAELAEARTECDQAVKLRDEELREWLLKLAQDARARAEGNFGDERDVPEGEAAAFQCAADSIFEEAER